MDYEDMMGDIFGGAFRKAAEPKMCQAAKTIKALNTELQTKIDDCVARHGRYIKPIIT